MVTVSTAQDALRVNRRRLGDLVRFVARCEGAELAAVDLAVVDESAMAELNRRYLGHSGTTDVISFDLSDASQRGIAAQVVVCGDVAARQGPLHGLTPAEELMLYVVHGLLHLMGYDDQSVRGASRMRARQDEILAAFVAKPRTQGGRGAGKAVKKSPASTGKRKGRHADA
ncbi:MAG: Endoribonuclease YbeY [Planctomycetes bacterium ADurb.Bin126]|nr:MAG: Endoribonuclease YbeY [Planctomycetes bacterium ADurb.Bin126]HOD79915.1 rRNA maturation RNase YbeY [Phycisphaerae bacterium]HQL73270.1 rRNA maturation RNase YbeY [Phycisphaerae bacterium]